MKQDYGLIRRAGAELIVISPDSPAEHRAYGLSLFGAELPYLFVSDPAYLIGRQYGVVRSAEHHQGGMYNRSLWVLDGKSTIVSCELPWTANKEEPAYQQLFQAIGSVPGHFLSVCLTGPSEVPATDQSQGVTTRCSEPLPDSACT